jgi:hypothetical protein
VPSSASKPSRVARRLRRRVGRRWRSSKLGRPDTGRPRWRRRTSAGSGEKVLTRRGEDGVSSQRVHSSVSGKSDGLAALLLPQSLNPLLFLLSKVISGQSPHPLTPLPRSYYIHRAFPQSHARVIIRAAISHSPAESGRCKSATPIFRLVFIAMPA